MCGNLGMLSNIESSHKRLALDNLGKFLKIELGCFSQIRDSLFKSLALGRCSGLRIQRNKSTFFSRRKDGRESHGTTMGENANRSIIFSETL